MLLMNELVFTAVCAEVCARRLEAMKAQRQNFINDLKYCTGHLAIEGGREGGRDAR
jgi:hypothetical protein